MTKSQHMNGKRDVDFDNIGLAIKSNFGDYSFIDKSNKIDMLAPLAIISMNT